MYVMHAPFPPPQKKTHYANLGGTAFFVVDVIKLQQARSILDHPFTSQS